MKKKIESTDRIVLEKKNEEREERRREEKRCTFPKINSKTIKVKSQFNKSEQTNRVFHFYQRFPCLINSLPPFFFPFQTLSQIYNDLLWKSFPLPLLCNLCEVKNKMKRRISFEPYFLFLLIY